MQCSSKTAIWASLAFGAALALYALDGPADYSPPTNRVVRGLSEIINGAIYAFGKVGAAMVFAIVGVMMAGVSAALCPTGRGQAA